MKRKPRGTVEIHCPPHIHCSDPSSLPPSLLLLTLICAMADWFVDPIVDMLINACSDYLQDLYFRWQTDMKEELERLRENHPKIQAVVSAYTRAQITDRNPALTRWIWQLRDANDKADDVLDDFEYVKLEEAPLFPPCSAPVLLLQASCTQSHPEHHLQNYLRRENGQIYS